jgi:hypothetical protein
MSLLRLTPIYVVNLKFVGGDVGRSRFSQAGPTSVDPFSPASTARGPQTRSVAAVTAGP